MIHRPATRQEEFFCAVTSRESGEDVFGTASLGTFWVLVEYAGLWAQRALEGSTLPDKVKARLAGLTETIPRARVLFIRAGRVGTDCFNLFAVRARERGPSVVRFQLRSYEDLLGVDYEGLAAGRAAGGETFDGPLFLVCTHGRRDKCCAKFGWPLYKSLRDVAAEGRVWQSSHVGGDRFAGNLVCFPHGLFYARADDGSGRRVVEEYAAGRLVTEGFRGRACYAHPVQAAEYFVRRESGLKGVEELHYVGAVNEGNATRRVTFASGGGGTLHDALITRRESDFRNLITCHAQAERRVPKYVLDDYRVRGAGARELA